MRKIYKLIVLSLLSLKLFSQETDSIRITGYYLILSYTDSIFNPHIYSGIIPSLNCCKSFNSDIDSIIKEFYECAVFIDDPLISLESCKAKYKSSIEYEQAYNATFNLVLKKFKRLSTKLFIKCSHQAFLNITAIKLSGIGWVIPNKDLPPKGNNSLYSLPDSIYPKSYYYCFSVIESLNKLNKYEKIELKKLFNETK